MTTYFHSAICFCRCQCGDSRVRALG